METLNKPLFFFAIGLIALCVAVELGIGSFLKDAQAARNGLDHAVAEAQSAGLSGFSQVDVDKAKADLTDQQRPGLGIRYMALLDGVVFVTVALMASSLLMPQSVHARVQGCLTAIGSCLLLLIGILLFVIALLLLFLMVGMFLAAPFGTIAYLAIFGFFDVRGAFVTLGLLMFLKLAFVGFLVASDQRFLQNKGFVFAVLTSLVANVIVSFLIGFPPRFLASITDSIAAIVVAILAVIWAMVLLVGALTSIVRGLKVA